MKTCSECSKSKAEIKELKNENQFLKTDGFELKSIINKLKDEEFSFINVQSDPEWFKKYTGLSVDRFNIPFESVNPGEKRDNLKYYAAAKRQAGQEVQSNVFHNDHSYSQEKKSKPGPKPKLDVIEQLFFFLTWLRCGFPQWNMSQLFKISLSTTSRYLITWANYLYFCLGCIPIWASRADIQRSIPECFKETYPDTRVIIDCTELYCQVPSALNTQSSLYSAYKYHVTYKGLTGIAPSCAVTFVSPLYQGRTSDKDIVGKCGLLDTQLWDANRDSVVADRGFTIEDDLRKINVALNIPAFLDGRDQLDEDEVLESQSIASVRIHVERLMSRLRNPDLSRRTLTMHGSITQIWTVCCLLCNFMDPLIKVQPAMEK